MKKTLALLVVFLLGTICAHAQQNKFRTARSPVKESYIVVLKDKALGASEDSLSMAASNLLARYGGEVKSVFGRALNGFAVRMSAEQAKLLAQDRAVEYVEEDGYLRIAQTTQTGAPWGLDRIDQRNLPLDGNYSYYSGASNVYAYILDTGIASHTEFGSRASVAVDVVNDGQNGFDCNGHGTAVAGIIGASTYGVAKSINLRAVRVADCSGSASASNVVAGLNWVISNRSNPAVVNMSLGDQGGSSAIDTAVNNTHSAGVTVVAAAGNLGEDACNHSPARVASAITVAATDADDTRWSDSSGVSNYGGCVDVFAPGVNITTTSSGGSTVTGSGTSFAAPHVAGVVAQYLAAFPQASPSNAASAIVNLATPNVVGKPGTGSPNLLLYTHFGPTSGTSVTSSTGGCLYTSSVTSGDGGFYGNFAAGGGSNPSLTIEKDVGGGTWSTVASVSGQNVLYAGTAGTYRMRACVSSGGGWGWFVAVFNYPTP